MPAALDPPPPAVPAVPATLQTPSTPAAAAAPPAVLLRRIAALAAPTTVPAGLQVLAQLADTALAARQGTAALAGWAVLLPLALLLQQTSAGAMGGGVVAAIARALGAGRPDEASALVRHALLIALAAGGAFALGVGLGAAPLLATVAGPASAQAATGYAWVLFGLGAIPVWLANTLASVLRGGGRHALAARVLTAAWAASPPLAWLLAEPAGLGLVGLGLALAGVHALAAAAMGVAVQRGGAGFAVRWRGPLEAALFRRILAVGALASALAALANLTTLAVTVQLRPHGPAAVAAFGVAARIEFLVVPVAFSVGTALTALVGRAAGAGQWAEARRIAWAGAALAGAAAALLGLACALAGPVLTPFASSDPEVAALAARMLGITGWAFGGFGLGLACNFAAMGAGRMAWPVGAALARFGLAVGGGALLAGATPLGLDGHLVGVALGIAAYGAVNAAGVRPAVWRAAPPR